jgi:hypothetical protein
MTMKRQRVKPRISPVAFGMVASGVFETRRPMRIYRRRIRRALLKGVAGSIELEPFQFLVQSQMMINRARRVAGINWKGKIRKGAVRRRAVPSTFKNCWNGFWVLFCRGIGRFVSDFERFTGVCNELNE